MTAADLLEVVVHSTTPAGDRVALIDLRSADSDAALPPFDAGAHIDIHVGGFVRQYSLVGSDDRRDRYLIGVLRERDGRGGSAAVHALSAGDRIRVSRPRNTFPLDPTADHSVLLAGGIGLTPMVAMAERLHREGASFELHAYSTTPASLPLGDHLASRPWRERLVVHHSSFGDGFRGNAPRVIPRPRRGLALYVCGPAGVIASATACASALGWPRTAVHVEHFGRSEILETGGEQFTVVPASTNLPLRIGMNETIAQVLIRHGFDVTLSCEQGLCGSCITGVLDGLPEHRDEVQTIEEHDANTRINVCCSRSRTPQLTLDI